MLPCRGKTSIGLEDAWLPGDRIAVGLGQSASQKDRIQVTVRDIMLGASVVSNASLERIFLHVTFAGSGGDAVDETLRCELNFELNFLYSTRLWTGKED